MTHMLFEPSHVSDEELLLSADGELPSKRASAVRRHLETCWECRTRVADFEGAIGDFIHIHHERFEAGIPPSDGPRSLLKATSQQLKRFQGKPQAPVCAAAALPSAPHCLSLRSF